MRMFANADPSDGGFEQVDSADAAYDIVKGVSLYRRFWVITSRWTTYVIGKKILNMVGVTLLSAVRKGQSASD